VNSLILIGLVILLVAILVRSRRKRAAAGATRPAPAKGRGLGLRRRAERETASAEAAAASVLEEPYAPMSASPLPTISSEPLPSPAAEPAPAAPSWNGPDDTIVEPGWPLPGEIAGGWSPVAEEAPVAPLVAPVAMTDEPTWLSEEPAEPVWAPAEDPAEVAGPPLWTPSAQREPIVVEGVDIAPAESESAPWHEELVVPEPIAHEPEPVVEPEPEPELVWAAPVAEPEPEPYELAAEPVEAMPAYVPPVEPAFEIEIEPEIDIEAEAEVEAEVAPAELATLLTAAAPVPALADLPDRPGVTPRMLAVVRSLAESPRGVTALAELHGSSRPVVSGICARLEEQGLVEKERDASDRRRVVLALTEAGWALHEEDVSASASLERAVARLSAAERRALDEGLRALARVCN
jgi:DNA-binding MarR family transcriptional regulator